MERTSQNTGPETTATSAKGGKHFGSGSKWDKKHLDYLGVVSPQLDEESGEDVTPTIDVFQEMGWDKEALPETVSESFLHAFSTNSNIRGKASAK